MTMQDGLRVLGLTAIDFCPQLIEVLALQLRGDRSRVRPNRTASAERFKPSIKCACWISRRSGAVTREPAPGEWRKKAVSIQSCSACRGDRSIALHYKDVSEIAEHNPEGLNAVSTTSPLLEEASRHPLDKRHRRWDAAADSFQRLY
jgi:hypothetical protein